MKKQLVSVCCFFGAGFAAAVVLSACAVSEPASADAPGIITLMTWNVHNLFDGKDDGDEYAEFLQSAGWSNEKYLGRINSISAAVEKIENQPDIIVLQEIESLQILEDIAFSLSGSYLFSCFAKNSGSAIGLGIISRFPLTGAKSHSITSYAAGTSPRPVLETEIQTDHGSIVIFACHWKSKIGTDEATESVRRSCARVILRRIREIWENDPMTGIIVCGDLNENFDEFLRRGSNVICALLPDDPQSAALTGADNEAQNDFIVVSGNKPPLPVSFPDETIVMFSPWANDLSRGSYYYKNNWETIDHFLVSYQFFDNAGWEYARTFIADFEPFAAVNGLPASYNQRTGNGFSDHLPLLMTLKTADRE